MARELAAEVREKKGRHAAQRLRNNAQIPAVIYREGKIGVNIAIPANEWAKVLTSHQRIVTLKMKGGDKQALIKDVQYDHLGEFTMHVDFNELKEGEKVRVAVAVITKGIPKGQIEGGVTNQASHTIHVECLPQDIPEKIVVDIEHIGLDQALHVKELKLPKGVVATDSPELVIVSVHKHKEEAAAPVEGAPTEPEVLTAKKEDPAAEGAAAPAAGAKKEEKKK